MNNSITRNIKKVGATVCILLISVVLIIIFLQSNKKVVEDNSSTTLRYNEKVESVVVNQTVREDVFKKYPSLQKEEVKTYGELTEAFEQAKIDKMKKGRQEYQRQIDEYKVKIAKIERQKKLEQERQKRLAERKKEKQKQMPSRGSSSVKRTITVVATAYTSYCQSGCIGITATGVNVKSQVNHQGARIIAVDPNVIPLHSVVKVYPNDREPFIAYAEDTGGDIKGYRIDYLISHNNTDMAFDFGKQTVKVEILREGKGD